MDENFCDGGELKNDYPRFN